MIKKIILLFLSFLLSYTFGFTQNKANYTRMKCVPDTITTSSTAYFTISIVIDSVILPKNTLLKLFFPKPFKQITFDNQPFVLFPETQKGYCKAKVSRAGKSASILSLNLTRDEFPNTYPYPTYNHDDNQNLMTIKLNDTLVVGDTIFVTYGIGNSIFGPAANYINTPNYSFKSEFRAMIDFDQNGTYTLQNSAAKVICNPKKADALKLYLASTGNINKPVLLKATVTDDIMNIIPTFTGSFLITCTDGSANFSSIVNFSATDSGHIELPITFHQNGVFTCNAQLISSNVPLTKMYRSNPINISTDSVQIYWGDFHTHTEYSRDGECNDAFNFAKYGVGLDFFAQTDHADGNGIAEYGINLDEEWKNVKNWVKQYNKPGRFATFLGYEESWSNPWGHYNMIFNATDDKIDSIPNWPKFNNYGIQAVWQKADVLPAGVEVLTIPHHTAQIQVASSGNCYYCTDFGGTFANQKYKRTIEIYSQHGFCEYYNPAHNLSYESVSNNGSASKNGPYYAQDAWAKREKLAVIASSDNHLARATGMGFGIMAILADSIERNNIFTHFKNKNCYATTGERIVVKFKINNAMMGEDLNLNCAQYPKIKFEINGTDTLDYIEILKWDFKNGTYSTNGNHPNFQVIKKYTITNNAFNYSDSLVDGTLKDSSMYYIRVKQKNKINNREVWAWGTPIWVNTAHCNDTLKDSILYLTVSDSTTSTFPYKIKVEWKILNQVAANYFIVQRSNDSIHFTDYAIVDAKDSIGKNVTYIFNDSFPNDTVLFYRVKLITYFDSVKTSKFDSIKISFRQDSILSFMAKLQNNGVKIDWTGKEFAATNYEVQRAPIHAVFAPIKNQLPAYTQTSTSYTFLDILPLKDSALYKVVMKFPNGTFKLSKTDTVYFVMDSVIDFYTQLIRNDSVLISWKGVHEHNTTSYTIERSPNKNIYSTLKSILPTGSLFDTAIYIEYDTMPMLGWNYYRVIQNITGNIHQNTKIDSERIVNVGLQSHFINDLDIKVANTFMKEGTQDVNVLTHSGKEYNGKFAIYESTGRLILTKDAKIPKGDGFFILDTAQMEAGAYFLLFMTETELVKKAFFIIDIH